jgi:hypothetical protein
MGVFISWSGKSSKSYLVAVALRGWLEQVIQGCGPWTSTQDIDVGERWGSELFTQLDVHKVGIICVTKENQGEPWLNFEAGALAKQLKGEKSAESRVCPLLIDLTASDVTGPLKLLQMVALERDGMFQIVQMINKHTIQNPLGEELLKKIFDKNWPDLQAELEKMKVPDQPPEKSSRPVEEILDEILSLVRAIDKTTNRPPGDPLSSPFVSAMPSSGTLGPFVGPMPSSGILGAIPSSGTAPVTWVTAAPPAITEAHLKFVAGERLNALALEVGKEDMALARAIEAADATYDGLTLTITLKQVISEQRLQLLKEIAERLGIKGLGIKMEIT